MPKYAYLTRMVEYNATARVRLPDDASMDPDDHDPDALANAVPTDDWNYPGEDNQYTIDYIVEED